MKRLFALLIAALSVLPAAHAQQITPPPFSGSYLPLNGGTLTGALTLPSLTISGIGGSTQCLEANSVGAISGTGVPCGSGGGGGISGPGSSVSGYAATWGNTAGTLLGAGLPIGTTGVNTIVETNGGGLIANSLISGLPNSSLANSGVTIAGVSVSLGGSGSLAASNLSNGTTGSGGVVLATSPTLTTPNLGTPSALTLTNATGLPLSGIVSIASGNVLGNVSGSAGVPTLVPVTQSGAASSLVETDSSGAVNAPAFLVNGQNLITIGTATIEPAVRIGPFASASQPLNAQFTTSIGPYTYESFTDTLAESLAIGPGAGISQQTCGGYFMGVSAGASFTTQCNGFAFGNDAMRDYWDSSGGMAIGAGTLDDGNGANNMAIGGAVMNGSQAHISVAAAPTAGDQLGITISSPNTCSTGGSVNCTTGTPQSISYTVQSGDTAAMAATGLMNAINAIYPNVNYTLGDGVREGDHNTFHLAAAIVPGNSNVIWMHVPANWQLAYTFSCTGSGCGSESVAIDSGFTGSNNVVIGAQAFQTHLLTSPTDDVIIGANTASGNAATNPSGDVFIGDGIAGNIVNANHDVGIGLDALNALTTGSNNVAEGPFAGFKISTGSGNVLLGDHTGFTTLAIGNNNFLVGSVDTAASNTSNTINIFGTWLAAGTNNPSTSITTLPGLLTVTGSVTLSSLISAPCVGTNGSGLLQSVACGGGTTSITIGSTVITGGTANGLLYDAAGKIGNLATANDGVLVTDVSGNPSISTTLPSGLTIPGYLTANQSITLGGDLSGSGTTSITATVGKVNGGAIPVSAPVVGTNSSGQLVSAPNSMTLAGHSVSLGGTQAFAASDLSNGVTGSGSVVLATSPALVTPNLGTPSAINLTNATNLPASALPTGVVTAGTYGDSTHVPAVTLDTTGRVTAVSSVAISGGGGTPGGTSGQVQFNNAGSFGGFTVGGDATLNTGTGALTVTKTGGVAFAASATTDTTNAANIASGTLAAARLPLGTSSAFGAVKCDGTTITCTAGVISAVGGGSGNVSGSGTSVSGDIPKLSNTTTTAMVDSGIAWPTGALQIIAGSGTTPGLYTLRGIGGNITVALDGSFIDLACPGCTGSVTSSPAGQLAGFSATGSTVIGQPDLTFNAGVETFGIAASVAGGAAIANGGAGGALVTIKNPSATAAYNWNLPATAGSTGAPLLSGGGGSTAMSWGALAGTGSKFATAASAYAASSPSVCTDASDNLTTTGCTGGGGATSLTGDTTGTGTGTIATTTVKVNNGAIPTSASYVGTNSSGQFVSAGAPATVLRSYIAGLITSNDGTNPNTTIDVGAGTAADSTNTAMLSLASPCQIVLTGTGAGGLDTGTIAPSSWYADFIINGGSGTSCIASKETAGTTPTPTLPSGYTLYRYIGSFATDASSHPVLYTQFGRRFTKLAPSLDLNAACLTTATLTAFQVPLGVVTIPYLRGQNVSASVNPWFLSSPSQTDQAVPVSASFTTPPGYTAGGVQMNGMMLESYLSDNSSGQMRWRCSSAGTNIAIYSDGWTDDAGAGQ